jgi:hypothetical protein
MTLFYHSGLAVAVAAGGTTIYSSVR